MSPEDRQWLNNTKLEAPNGVETGMYFTPNSSKLANLMEEAGYVEVIHNPLNAKQYACRLTEEGVAWMTAMML